MGTRELLTIKELTEVGDALQKIGIKGLPFCKTYIINGEIYFDKRELLNSLLQDRVIESNLECFSKSEVIKIIGYEDDNFPPSFKTKDALFWERSGLVEYLAKKHLDWKLLKIEEHIENVKK
jgi:hypothetical protein